MTNQELEIVMREIWGRQNPKREFLDKFLSEAVKLNPKFFQAVAELGEKLNIERN